MSEKGPGKWSIPEIDEHTLVPMRYPEPHPESLTLEEQSLVAAYIESVATAGLAARIKATTLGIQEVMRVRAKSRGENDE